MYLIIMLLNLIHSINLSHHYLLLLLPQFSLNLSPQNLKRAQQSWSAKSQQAAAQTGAALVSIVPSSSNGNLPSMDPWLAPRAVPGSPHGPEIATRRPPVTDRVNEIRQYTRCRQRTMGAWGSIRSCRLLCACCGVLVICEKQFEGFCWGLEPQLLLVQQAEDELQCS